MGKAQEIIKIFNEFTNIPVVTSESISRINTAYEKNGVKLKYVDFMSEEGKELLKQPHIQVVNHREKFSISDHCSFAKATGWALKFGILRVVYYILPTVNLTNSYEIIFMRNYLKEVIFSQISDAIVYL